MGKREVNAAAHGETPFKNPLEFFDGIQWPAPFFKEDWEKTPEAVRVYIPRLHQGIDAQDETIHPMSQRIDELESRTKRNSSNSNQPPSNAPPVQEKKPKTSQRAKNPVAKKVTRVHSQEFLKPSHTEPLKPECRSCGITDFPETQLYYTHQYIELPEIQMQVTHFVLHRGQCPYCGKTVKAILPNAYRTGFGPRLSAIVSAQAKGFIANGSDCSKPVWTI